MQEDGLKLFGSLAAARWTTASRTYGNNHATLIGVLVDWWISQDTSYNWVLESGPAVRLPGTGARERRHCDAIFGRGRDAVGVLEVEGMRQSLTAAKIGHYFNSTDDDFAGLKFAILVCYSCGATGPADERIFRLNQLEEARAQLASVSKSSSDRDLYLVVVQKVPDKDVCSIRQGKYYCGRVSTVQAYWYRAGVKIREKFLFGENDQD